MGVAVGAVQGRGARSRICPRDTWVGVWGWVWGQGRGQRGGTGGGIALGMGHVVSPSGSPGAPVVTVWLRLWWLVGWSGGVTGSGCTPRCSTWGGVLGEMMCPPQDRGWGCRETPPVLLSSPSLQTSPPPKNDISAHERLQFHFFHTGGHRAEVAPAAFPGFGSSLPPAKRRCCFWGQVLCGDIEPQPRGEGLKRSQTTPGPPSRETWRCRRN